MRKHDQHVEISAAKSPHVRKTLPLTPTTINTTTTTTTTTNASLGCLELCVPISL